MAFVSVTRLRIRAIRFLPPFLWRNEQAVRQIRSAPGFLGGKLLVDARRTFWTMTTWRDEAAMRAYIIAGAHRRAMPELLPWCDEASVAHWPQDSAELPDWTTAHRRMALEGRPSKVSFPAPAHTQRQIPPPRTSPLRERVVFPVTSKEGKPKGR